MSLSRKPRPRTKKAWLASRSGVASTTWPSFRGRAGPAFQGRGASRALDATRPVLREPRLRNERQPGRDGDAHAHPAPAVTGQHGRAIACRGHVEGREASGDPVEIVEIVDRHGDLAKLAAGRGLETKLLAADGGGEDPGARLGETKVAIEGRRRRDVGDAERHGETDGATPS